MRALVIGGLVTLLACPLPAMAQATFGTKPVTFHLQRAAVGS